MIKCEKCGKEYKETTVEATAEDIKYQLFELYSVLKDYPDFKFKISYVDCPLCDFRTIVVDANELAQIMLKHNLL
jgi:DNA-directed RNA polymerase subunit RPC12/RpoP